MAQTERTVEIIKDSLSDPLDGYDLAWASDDLYYLLTEIERLQGALLDIASGCDHCNSEDAVLLSAIARRALSTKRPDFDSVYQQIHQGIIDDSSVSNPSYGRDKEAERLRKALVDISKHYPDIRLLQALVKRALNNQVDKKEDE